MEPLSADQRDRYLERIRLRGRTDADLAELQFAHPQHVPFENLSIHLGEPIELGTEALFDHMALGVGNLLVDVGFGRRSARPLRIDADSDQPDLFGTFRVIAAAPGDLDVLRDGEPQYRAELRPRRMSDFEPTCWWQTGL